jgi:hypothetical protein
MKTKTSLIAGLTTALLFGTAWSVAAISVQPPKVRHNNIQKEADRTGSPRTGSLPPASCKRWDVGGQWELRQTNGTIFQVNLQLGEWQQQSANLTGTGILINTPASNGKPQAGVISGNITGNAFTMLITSDGAKYRFTGTVGPGGRIQGTTSNGVPWASSKRMKCAD